MQPTNDFLEYFEYDEVTNKTECLVCSKVYTGFNKQYLKRHLFNQHPSQAEGPDVACNNQVTFEQAPPAEKFKEEPPSPRGSIQSVIKWIIVWILNELIWVLSSFRVGHTIRTLTGLAQWNQRTSWSTSSTTKLGTKRDAYFARMCTLDSSNRIWSDTLLNNIRAKRKL